MNDSNCRYCLQNDYLSLFTISKIDFCYLYGSCSKGYATETSDIDLCVSTSLKGLQYVGLSEAIRNLSHKRIDMVRITDLIDNLELVIEIMKDSIKIYQTSMI